MKVHSSEPLEAIGLPSVTSGKDGEVYLEDARLWVHKKAQELTSDENGKTGDKKFDYIIHDVFSGGVVPVHLFTMEFFVELKSLLRENGVIAIVCFTCLCFTKL